jgi:hypothetical protein
MATQNRVSELCPPNWKPARSWRQIAEEASREQNDERLMELTDELLDGLCKDPD